MQQNRTWQDRSVEVVRTIVSSPEMKDESQFTFLVNARLIIGVIDSFIDLIPLDDAYEAKRHHYRLR